ncbi:Aste57867_9746 [Aphanomyces stellatus]|uniref:Aste57867_9746 protein n=1 Tax=Aphanomyces stellatus TaxID=120398 RepID=A0A485KP82_9STRA|nr:hypothetical protein As57867_009707 [Aphanomyces stellatus]VFT86625.1 Aste57867_9746 [Aphanomyces stellatus]
MVTTFPTLLPAQPGANVLDAIGPVPLEQLLNERDCARRSTEDYEWNLIGVYQSHAEARDAVAPSATYSNTKTKCTLCRKTERHKMTTRYFVCHCRADCPKFIRILECLLVGSASSGNFVSITGQYGECAPPARSSMTKGIQEQAELLFELGYTPSRARHKLKEKIGDNDMPSLSKFQTRYSYFRYHKMLEHSKTSVMMDLLATSFYKDDVGDNKMFSFGFSLIDGRPAVGFGGVSGPFKVGVTTKALLRLMDRNPKTFVFHWNATYKIDNLAYPILVCGVSDAARKFTQLYAICVLAILKFLSAAVYSEKCTHGLCATFVLLGDVVEEYSTFHMYTTLPWNHPCTTSSGLFPKQISSFRTQTVHGFLIRAKFDYYILDVPKPSKFHCNTSCD